MLSRKLEILAFAFLRLSSEAKEEEEKEETLTEELFQLWKLLFNTQRKNFAPKLSQRFKSFYLGQKYLWRKEKWLKITSQWSALQTVGNFTLWQFNQIQLNPDVAGIGLEL